MSSPQSIYSDPFWDALDAQYEKTWREDAKCIVDGVLIRPTSFMRWMGEMMRQEFQNALWFWNYEPSIYEQNHFMLIDVTRQAFSRKRP